MAARFTQGHYEKVADVLNQVMVEMVAHTPSRESGLVNKIMAAYITGFCTLFKADNERFKPDLFIRRATNIPPHESDPGVEG